MRTQAHTSRWQFLSPNQSRTMSGYAAGGAVARPTTTDLAWQQCRRPCMWVLEQNKPVPNLPKWDIRHDLEHSDRAESLVTVVRERPAFGLQSRPRCVEGYVLNQRRPVRQMQKQVIDD